MKKNNIKFCLSLFVCLLMSCAMSIYVLEYMFQHANQNTITYIHYKDDYEYSIFIPTYWNVNKAEENTDDLVFSGSYENLKLNFRERLDDYNFHSYGSFITISSQDKYRDISLEPEDIMVDNHHIYINRFFYNGFVINIGFVEYDDFLLEFEYALGGENDISTDLYSIITSIVRFGVKEAILYETPQN